MHAELWGQHWAEAIFSEPSGFMADLHTALVEHVLCCAKRTWEPNAHHHRQADDFRRGFKLAEGRAEGAFRNQNQFDTNICRETESLQPDRGYRPRLSSCTPIKLARALERFALLDAQTHEP